MTRVSADLSALVRDGRRDVVRALEAEGADVVAVHVEGRDTIATGWNKAIASARGNRLLFLDGRCSPLPGLVARCARFLTSHPASDVLRLGVARGAATRSTILADWLWSSGRLVAEPSGAGIYTWPHFRLTLLACRRDLLSAVSFDERFAALEDLELGVRVAAAGPLRVHFDPMPHALFDSAPTIDEALRAEYAEGYYRALRVRVNPSAPSLDDLADRFAFPEAFALTTAAEREALRTSAVALADTIDPSELPFIDGDASARLALLHSLYEQLFSDAAARGWLDAEGATNADATAPPRAASGRRPASARTSASGRTGCRRRRESCWNRR